METIKFNDTSLCKFAMYKIKFTDKAYYIIPYLIYLIYKYNYIKKIADLRYEIISS